MDISRRKVLACASLAGAAALGGYSFYRGLRFPPPSFTLQSPSYSRSLKGLNVRAKDAYFQEDKGRTLYFRATGPEPSVQIDSELSGEWELVLENIHPNNRLSSGSTALQEVSNGITRTIKIKNDSKLSEKLDWIMPDSDEYTFAAIGDTGGDLELQWVMKRCEQLGVRFLLHMGDFFYEEGDFEAAKKHLNEASIPTYSAIGNHDYHVNLTAIYPTFNSIIGPNNSWFRYGGIEYVNFDTAAAFWPASRGLRGELLSSMKPLSELEGIRDRVLFTHKPLTDINEERSHDIPKSEGNWIRQQVLSKDSHRLLAGHIHEKLEYDDQGLFTYVTGQGLAHADLLVQRPYAEILIGKVTPNEKVAYHWEPINMPYKRHCNIRNLEVLWRTPGREQELEKLKAHCNKPQPFS